jgi:cytochrome c553
MKTKIIIKSTIITTALLLLLTATTQADDTKALYEKTCASCHGKDGRGQTTMGRKVGVKDYTDAKVQTELTDDKAMKTINEGIKDDKGKVLMKPYADALSADQIKSLVAYLRTFKAP